MFVGLSVGGRAFPMALLRDRESILGTSPRMKNFRR